MLNTYLNIHGESVHLQFGDSSVHDLLKEDFSYFAADTLTADGLKITLVDKSPQWKTRFSLWGRTFYSGPKGHRRVSFFPGVWVDYQFEAGVADIYYKDANLVYETCYQVLLSWVGERLDRRGIHRVHGLGVCQGGSGTLFLGASGTGKSTVALQLLEEGEIKWLSDDVPFVTSSGVMLAFPQRIALREPPSNPDRNFRSFKRFRFGRKYIIGSDSFRSLIQPKAPLDRIVKMRRGSFVGTTKLSPLVTLLYLCRWLVVGHETPQFWELFLRLEVKDVFYKLKILRSRIGLALLLCRKVEMCGFVLSSERAKNPPVLLSLLGERCS